VSGVLHILVPGPPVPCGRARTGKGKTFTPQRTRDYEQLVAAMSRLAVSKARWAPPEGSTFAVTLDVYRARRTGDVDNYLKAALDGMNGIVFADDRLVVAATVRLHVDTAYPRAEIAVETAVEVAA
jgi:Holliday junction resolvase RusA-like endonuclease